MAITPARVTARVLARIANSEYTLTVFYPKATTKPTGAGANPLPMSPLLPTPNPVSAIEDLPERVLPEVSMPCLFTEVSMISQAQRGRVEADVGGWMQGTVALARVSTADAELDSGGTVFDGAAFVEVSGRRYRVINVVRVTASTTTQGTYYIQLTGTSKE